MQIEDYDSLLAEYYLTPLQREIAAALLGVLAALDNAVITRDNFDDYFVQRRASAYQVFSPLGLSDETRRGVFSFFDVQKERLPQLQLDLIRVLGDVTFCWGRVLNMLLTEDLDIKDEDPLKESMLPVWNALLPGDSGMRGSFLRQEALVFTSDIAEFLASPEAAILPTEARPLPHLRTRHEHRYFGAIAESLAIIRYLRYLYEAIAVWEDAADPSNQKSAELRAVEQSLSDTVDQLLDQLPTMLFGYRFSNELVTARGGRIHEEAPLSNTSLSAWHLVGEGPAREQLADSRVHAENIFSVVRQAIHGGM